VVDRDIVGADDFLGGVEVDIAEIVNACETKYRLDALSENIFGMMSALKPGKPGLGPPRKSFVNRIKSAEEATHHHATKLQSIWRGKMGRTIAHGVDVAAHSIAHGVDVAAHSAAHLAHNAGQGAAHGVATFAHGASSRLHLNTWTHKGEFANQPEKEKVLATSDQHR
jgi:hypothetical protein